MSKFLLKVISMGVIIYSLVTQVNDFNPGRSSQALTRPWLGRRHVMPRTIIDKPSVMVFFIEKQNETYFLPEVSRCFQAASS